MIEKGILGAVEAGSFLAAITKRLFKEHHFMLCLKSTFRTIVLNNFDCLLSFGNDVNKNGSHLLAAVLIDFDITYSLITPRRFASL
jgi:hypothetical protein